MNQQIEPVHSPTTYASYQSVNRLKNRYPQISACELSYNWVTHVSSCVLSSDDHSRVQLEQFVDIPGSDYINANFIDVSAALC